MTSRERIRKIMNLEVPDRVGMYDSHWLGAIERWEKEDLPIPSPTLRQHSLPRSHQLASLNTPHSAPTDTTNRRRC